MSKFNTSNAANSIVNIIQTSIGNAAFDTTIRAIVQEKVDEATGKFKLQYQDGLFYAFADDVKVNYSKGTEVFVLVPKNDFTQDKRIIGSVKTLGENYAKVYSYDERYKKIGSSAFGEAVNNNSWTFPTSGGQRLRIWPDSTTSEDPKIVFDDTFLNYLKNDAVTGLWLEAEFTTDIDLQYKKDASYGLLLTAEMEGSESQIGFQFDINDFTGNPFSQVNSRQIVVWEDMAWKKISQITGLYAFCNGLEGNLISVKNIKMYAVSAFTEEQLNMPYVDFYTPEGLYIKDTPGITLKAQLHIDQKIVTNGVKYYWFRETPSVFKDSQVFHPYAGNGWELLNGYEITTDVETEKKISVVKDTDKQVLRLGSPSSNSNELPLSPDFSVEKIMCVVAKSDSERYSSIIEVYNNQWESPYWIYYTTDSGNIVPATPIELFDTDIILKCKKEVSNAPEDSPNTENAQVALLMAEEIPEIPNPEGSESMDGENLVSADWYKKDISSQEYVKISSSAERLTVKPADVDNQATYCAMVDGIQTNEIIIIKKQQLPEQKQYQLFIYGGDQKFLYDENGRSPTHPAREFPEFPSELSFKLYDHVNGSEVEISDPNNVVWGKGDADSLINTIQPYDAANAKCRFTIQDSWKYNTTDNQITLTVKYNGIELTATTNFVFVKQGDPGTNGTEDVYWIQLIEGADHDLDQCQLNLYSSSQGHITTATFETFPPLKNEEGALFSLGNSFETSGFQHTVEGVKYVAPNGVTYVANSQFLYFIAKVDGQTKAFYCTNWKDTAFLPTPLSQGQYIVYDADGQNPKYANSKTIDNIEIPIADKVKNLHDIKTYTAALAKNNGLTGITYELKDDKGNITATYYITLYASLNRHAFSMVNGWDGNLKIDEGGNAILAQTLIAGKKDSANKFTGIMAGTIGDSKGTEKTGFFGFNQGAQTVFINAADGSTILGPSTAPLIQIGKGVGEEFIQSSNYSTNELTQYKLIDEDGTTHYVDEDKVTENKDDTTGNTISITYDDKTYSEGYFKEIYSRNQGMRIDLDDGNIYAPGYSIINGDATFEGTVNARSGHFTDDVTLGGENMKVSSMLTSLNSKIESISASLSNGQFSLSYKQGGKDFPVLTNEPIEGEVTLKQLSNITKNGIYDDGEGKVIIAATAIKTGMIGVYPSSTAVAPVGWLGAGQGDDGTIVETEGVMLSSADRGVDTGVTVPISNYLILTNAGVRLTTEELSFPNRDYVAASLWLTATYPATIVLQSDRLERRIWDDGIGEYRRYIIEIEE